MKKWLVEGVNEVLDSDLAYIAVKYGNIDGLTDLAVDVIFRRLEAFYAEREAAGLLGRAPETAWLFDPKARVAVKREVVKGVKARGIDLRVNAIRNDRVVGRGTCSWIDECLTDAELAAHLDKAGKRTPKTAVAWARTAHNVWEDVAADIRNA